MGTKKLLKRLAELVKGNPTVSDVHVASGGGMAPGKRKKKPTKPVSYEPELAKRSALEAFEDELILKSLETELARHAHFFQKAEHPWMGATGERCRVCGAPGSDGTVCKAVGEDRSHLPEMYRHWIGLEKSEWDTAFANTLPDTAFAVIMPGGTTDGDGKTTPRILRKLAYRDASGQVDLPHLRHALARLPQTDLPPSERAAARRKLEAAAGTTVVGTSDDGLTFLKSAAEEQKLFLIVSEPGEEDTQGDVISAEDIETAAHDFMVRYRKGETRLRLQHAADLTDDQAVLVEHYIAPTDFTMGGQAVKKGSWIQGWYVPDTEIWKAATAGHFTGASLGGTGIRKPAVKEDHPAPPAATPAAGVTINMISGQGGGAVRVEHDEKGRAVRYIKEPVDDITLQVLAGSSS